MSSRQMCITSLLMLIMTGRAAAQSVMLGEAPLVDSCCRVQLALDLKGKITFQQGGKTQTVEHNATAAHTYVERVLDAKGAMSDRTARIYQAATATIAGQTRSIRPERAFMVAQRIKDQLVTYSPAGPLLVEEMELTEHFDTLALPGLLPGGQVKVGESWKLSPLVVQAICGLDGLDAQAKQEVVCELRAIDGDLAWVAIQGAARGIQLGAAVSIHIDARSKLAFDRKQRRIVELEWRQRDERQQGPASPNLAADVIVKMRRTPIDTPKELGQSALLSLPAQPPARLMNIVQRDAKGKYEFQCSREWQDVGEHGGQRILKLVTASGDHLADAAVMPWKGPKIGDAQAFKRQTEETPGWQQESDSQLDAALKHPAGYTVYRVTAAGKLEGVPAVRTAYLITGAGGQQLLVTFIAPPSLAGRLEGRDQTLVDGVELK